MSLVDDFVPQPKHLPSGHVYGNDGSGKYHFQPTPVTSRLAERFEHVIDRLGDLQNLPIGPALILSLPIRNAVCTPRSLSAAAAAMHNVYRCGNHIALEWTLSHGWRDRRYLEPLTARLIGSLDRPHRITIRDRRQASQILQQAMGESDSKRAWHSFCACAAAWWSDPLPYLIWSHCAGVQPLQPLSRGAWARYHTKLPLLATATLAMVEVTPTQSAYFSASGQSAQADCILRAIDAVKQARRKHKSRQAFTDAALRDLYEQLHEAQRAGRLQVLLIGFVIDLVTNGGIKGELAIDSLVGYLLQTLIRLFNALLDKDLSALGGEGWRAIYMFVLKDDTIGKRQRSKIAATLSAFHDFISWLGVPPLPGGTGSRGATLPPRAEVVWPSEIERSVEWLEAAAANGDRMARQCILALLLVNEFMVRIEEILGLRCGDFRATESGLTIYVYPRTRDGRLKAHSVRRPVDLKSAELTRRLRAWLAQRRIEAAEDEDFLFGSPRESRARFQHGQTYALVERALKVGSGAVDATSHGPRHRIGSEDGAQVCMPTTQLVDINPIDQISASSGQGVTHSLRSTYLNIFEEPLWAFALSAWGDQDTHSGVCLPPWMPTVDQGIVLDRTGAWKQMTYQPPPPEPVSFQTVLWVLTDLSQELSTETTRARNGVTRSDIKVIARAASLALNKVRPKAEQRLDGGGDFAAHQLTLIELEPLFAAHAQEKYQPVLQWLGSACSSAASKQVLKNALSEWKGVTKGYSLSLDNVHDALGLIALLKASGVPKQRLLITHRCPAARLRPAIRQLAWRLRFEEKVRRGLPRVRLHICSVDSDSSGAIDSAISVKGLLGLLAAAEAWFAIRESKEHV